MLGAAPAGAGRGEQRRQWRRRGQPAAPPPRGERWVLGKFLPHQEKARQGGLEGANRGLRRSVPTLSCGGFGFCAQGPRSQRP